MNLAPTMDIRSAILDDLRAGQCTVSAMAAKLRQPLVYVRQEIARLAAADLIHAAPITTTTRRTLIVYRLTPAT